MFECVQIFVCHNGNCQNSHIYRKLRVKWRHSCFSKSLNSVSKHSTERTEKWMWPQKVCFVSSEFFHALSTIIDINRNHSGEPNLTFPMIFFNRFSWDTERIWRSNWESQFLLHRCRIHWFEQWAHVPVQHTIRFIQENMQRNEWLHHHSTRDHSISSMHR